MEHFTNVLIDGILFILVEYKYSPAKVSYILQTFGIALSRWRILYN